ncbi:MAG: amidohydrolase family protein [Planctomycetes bacterium]|nr:amidohydrolase family protein [Planctomycetota bacterium]
MALVINNVKPVIPGEAVRDGAVLVDGGKIAGVGGAEMKIPAGAEVIDGEGGYLAPGFVDLHCHGGAGYDLTSGRYDAAAEGFRTDEETRRKGPAEISRAHAKHGTTTLLLGTIAAPIGEIKASLEGLAENIGAVENGGRLEGAYCEGTFLKEQAYAGAQSEKYFREPDIALFEELNEAAGGTIRVVTVAPEYGEPAIRLIRHLSERGVVPATGHSAARYAETMAAIDAGMRLATHYSNGPIFTTFKPPGGAMEAIMEREEVVLELICDGYHINPRYVMDFLGARGLKAALITDAMPPVEAAGIKGFVIGDKRGVMSDDGGVLRLEGTEFTLFGSILTMDRAVANVARWLAGNHPGVYTRGVFDEAPTFGEALAHAVKMATEIPAGVLGLKDRGRLEKGKLADMVLLDGELAVRKVFVGGRETAVG